MMHIKFIEKEAETKPQISRLKEIMKIEVGINQIETKILKQIISGTKSWFFRKINKIGKPLTKRETEDKY
jgi:hypothetical protein